MSKPAARIGDMHVCPMVTPGTPPIPHVGGPITGPGVPTVLIGGKPAAVMGDMCVCTGPPDTIALGSTGVMIGGKPAARMGDMCAHGGTIVIGQPNVLIGEMSPGAPGAPAMMANFLNQVSKLPFGKAGALATRQVMTLNQAAVDGVPFCEICQADEESESEREKNPRITMLVWLDGDRIVENSSSGKDLKIRAQVMDIDDGEIVTFSVSDPSADGDEVVELSGMVKDGYVEVDWKVNDIDGDEG